MRNYHEARMVRDKELYERQIKVVDAQIDKLVYGLYGLTEDEIDNSEEIAINGIATNAAI